MPGGPLPCAVRTGGQNKWLESASSSAFVADYDFGFMAAHT